MSAGRSGETAERHIGAIERWHPRLDRYLDASRRPIVLADGLIWPEGPTWDSKRNCLYFSDIPANRIYQWSSAGGLTVRRAPAGSLGEAAVDPEVMPGTNGLLYLPEEDALLICDQDSRSLRKLSLASGALSEVLDSGGTPFNSPNDLVVSRGGVIYFTDPPYGLRKGNRSAARRRAFNGVYQSDGSGGARLVSRAMSYPNGIALSVDERYLYVSQSDEQAPLIRRFRLEDGRAVDDGEVWYDMAAHRSADSPGLPDGMTVAHDGTVFATAPGGVIVISPDGSALGRIFTGRATANCCFGEDGRTLFVTADKCLLQLRTLTRAPG
ncbi:gluconolactonase [Steroidobacter agaridevorans]|uniref:Gluconolactonase n=1 Tax=Steroidobacter agaridevorans TaxID=2695856 RepID=A0A829Y7K8_9GAMM|nr:MULTISPECIES: SMP-30/gluconolactonase/LRE family protein [Steroidobacteraceae]GFE79227.1 gluconolactonase [Steroidobacter agaridevorans]GFE87269.1 gluconolactonase [Steroidobacter agaridevorans]